MLKNTIQGYLYHRQEELYEIGKMLKLIIICVYIILPFAIVESIRQTFFYNQEFFLSFMFWITVILLIVYWMPNKKELKEWRKKSHSTF